MTNYVTGYLPTVEPKDWMKIAVGGVLGAVQLKDLKSFVGASGGSNANTIQLSDVTIPSDTVIYTDDASGSTFQLTFNPIGANENVTVKDISTNNALTSATYNASTRTVNAVGKTSGENSTILVSWGTGSKQFTIPVKTKNNNGSDQTTDWAVNASPQSLSSSDFDSNGLTMTSRQSGSYGDAKVSKITITPTNGSETTESLDNYTFDYNSGRNSVITIKPKSTGTISTSSTVNIVLTLGSETRTVSFDVQVVTKPKDKWSFSPESESVNLDDLVSTGVQTWSRDNTGSGEVITWDKVDNHTLDQFKISANENSSGQQTIKLKDKTTVTTGESLVFYATGGGTQNTFTIKINPTASSN
jgi:hypothetical protein